MSFKLATWSFFASPFQAFISCSFVKPFEENGHGVRIPLVSVCLSDGCVICDLGATKGKSEAIESNTRVEKWFSGRVRFLWRAQEVHGVGERCSF